MPKPHHSVLQAGCPSCHPTNNVKALKDIFLTVTATNIVRWIFNSKFHLEIALIVDLRILSPQLMLSPSGIYC